MPAIIQTKPKVKLVASEDVIENGKIILLPLSSKLQAFISKFPEDKKDSFSLVWPEEPEDDSSPVVLCLRMLHSS